MVYRKPFTPDQWREAVREYESFRKHVRELRKSFPPVSRRERRAFKTYQNSVRAIGETLRDRFRVRVEDLNAEIQMAKNAMTEYFHAKQSGG